MAHTEEVLELADNDLESLFFMRMSTSTPVPARSRAAPGRVMATMTMGAALGAVLSIATIAVTEVGSAVAGAGAVA